MDIATLKRVDAGLWVLEKYFVIAGCRASVRMTVAQVGDGLMLYSPVEMDEAQRAAINALGPVRLIVAPNLFHHLFLRSAMEAWPDARVLVPEGLEAKIGAVAGAETMMQGAGLKIGEEYDAFVFSGHNIHETMFWQAATKTLITSDLIYNYQREQYTAEKLFFRCIGCYGAPKVPFYHRFSITDRASLAALIEWVEAHEINRLVMSHGRIYEGSDAGATFKSAWARF